MLLYGREGGYAPLIMRRAWFGRCNGIMHIL